MCYHVAELDGYKTKSFSLAGGINLGRGQNEVLSSFLASLCPLQLQGKRNLDNDKVRALESSGAMAHCP